ncbi:hypothetical protein [Streptomyces sp. NBRC 110465]|uniref:hypothetical protein n=1 Tax=Streptomyces sp. NBRC 110465 TaxID=1897621 RepID=UPI0011612291|nr:hypothetical protein [Streptomyces sp. NBRC 110465]
MSSSPERGGRPEAARPGRGPVTARDCRLPSPAAGAGPQLPLPANTRDLAGAGLTLAEAEVTAQHTTMAERRVWLSIPVLARPDTGLSYRQQMEILEKAYAQTRPNNVTVTRWLVVAQRGGAPE